MERGRKRKSIVLGLVIVMVLTLTIGYSAISRSLTIRGAGTMDPVVWDIHFANLSKPNIKGRARIGELPEIASSGVEITNINAELKVPGDEVEYRVDIVNEGDIDAKIASINKPQLTEVQSKVLEFTVKYTSDGKEVNENDVLPKRSSSNVIIKIRYIEEIEEEEDLLANDITVNLGYSINYEQTNEDTEEVHTGNEKGTSGMTRSNAYVEKVDISENNDGSIYAYRFKDGSVVIKGEGELPDNLDDTLVFYAEGLTDNYNLVLDEMGYTEYRMKDEDFSGDMEQVLTVAAAVQILHDHNYNTTGITDMNSLLTYLQENKLMDSESGQPVDWLMTAMGSEQEKIENFENYLQLTTIKKSLNSLGDHGADNITDMNDLMTYIQSSEYWDTDNNQPTEELNAAVEEANNDFNAEPQSPTSIVLEEGITNIPEGLFTGNENIENIVIPSSVTSIAANAFQYCRNLESIHLSSNLQTIGNNAFQGCSSLNNVQLPDSLTSIGTYAFQNCTSLTSISIPSRVTTVSESAFNGCTSLVSVKLGSGTTTIGNSAFGGCTNLATVTQSGTTNVSNMANVEELAVNTAVRTIGSNAFQSDSNLSSINILNNATSIGDCAFSNCSSLNNVKISSLQSIGIFAFQNCIGITSLTIPSTLTSISTDVFNGCSGLIELTISNGITSLPSYIFGGCTGLTDVTIPDSVTDLQQYAFNNCTNLEKVYISGTTTWISSGSAFTNCPKYKELYLGGTGSMSSINVPWASSNTIEKVEISDGIINIGVNQFKDFKKLSYVKIPSTITSVGNFAFSMTNITTVDFLGTLNDWCNINFSNEFSNPLYNGASLYIQNQLLRRITATDNISSIKKNVFIGCTSLIEVSLPNSITSIGNSSFSQCVNITSFVIPTSVSSIGSFAFRNLSSLTNITIPNSVTNMGGAVFYEWTSSQTINIDNTSSYVSSNWDSNWEQESSAAVNYLRT